MGTDAVKFPPFHRALATSGRRCEGLQDLRETNVSIRGYADERAADFKIASRDGHSSADGGRGGERWVETKVEDVEG